MGLNQEILTDLGWSLVDTPEGRFRWHSPIFYNPQVLKDNVVPIIELMYEDLKTIDSDLAQMILESGPHEAKHAAADVQIAIRGGRVGFESKGFYYHPEGERSDREIAICICGPGVEEMNFADWDLLRKLVIGQMGYSPDPYDPATKKLVEGFFQEARKQLKKWGFS